MLEILKYLERMEQCGDAVVGCEQAVCAEKGDFLIAVAGAFANAVAAEVSSHATNDNQQVGAFN